MWLGESEKAIAAAFEEAADLRAFLVLDEVDSLLRDRRAAQQSWEVTQVNEMLTRMERSPLSLRLHNQRAGPCADGLKPTCRPRRKGAQEHRAASARLSVGA